jgi:putative addiction module killer protein
MREVTQFNILEYIEPSGENPFRKWLTELSDAHTARIQARLFRAEGGNLGDHKPLGAGVYELRMDFGPGFRVYFGLEHRTPVLLLCGGDKSSQRSDIAKAKNYWRQYLKGI